MTNKIEVKHKELQIRKAIINGLIAFHKIKTFYIVLKPLICYKKTYLNYNNLIITLELPKNTIFHLDDYDFTYTSSNVKCRANQAKVISFTPNTKEKIYSYKKSTFEYKIGKIVKPRKKFSFAAIDCESGIHFFFTKEAAIDFDL